MIKVKCLINYHDSCHKKKLFLKLKEIENIFSLALYNAMSSIYKGEIKGKYLINVLITDNKEIRKLNNSYRSANKPTNVLSFPLFESLSEIKLNNYQYINLGDIAFSLEKIYEECKIQNKLVKNHFTHLLLHSALHLCGFDHLTNQEAESMEKIEINCLRFLGIENPYLII